MAEHDVDNIDYGIDIDNTTISHLVVDLPKYRSEISSSTLSLLTSKDYHSWEEDGCNYDCDSLEEDADDPW